MSVNQLLLCKRLCGEAGEFVERSDPVSCGLAISLFQDAVEMCVWTLVKERNITVKESASFSSNLESVQKAGIALQHVAKLVELNKARVGFKHYGNLPAPDEARKFQSYVEDFLRACFADHFGHRYDDLSLVDLVSDEDVRHRLKEAERLTSIGDFASASFEAAVAKTILFSRLDRFVPQVDTHLRTIDGALPHEQPFQSLRAFSYLAHYLEVLRETALASLLAIPLGDHFIIRKVLPMVHKEKDGTWHWSSGGPTASSEKVCKRAVTCLVNIAIRLDNIL